MGSSVPIQKWFTLEGEVPAGDSKIIDKLPFHTTRLVKYLNSIYNDVEGKSSASELLGSKKSSTINDSVYGILGDYLDIDINLLHVGSEIHLEIINNEIYPVNYSVLRTSI